MENAKAVAVVEAKLLNTELTTLQKLLDDDPVDVDEIKIQFSFVGRQLSSYLKATSAYQALLLQNKKHDEHETERIEERKLMKTYTRLEFQASPYITQRGAGPSTSSGGSSSNSKDPYKMKLPKRQLPTFDGEVRNWLQFWAQFEEIHRDPDMPASEKFHYLFHSTVPDSPARRVVESYPMSSDTYPLAIESLKENFGREKMLVKVYIRDLLKLVIENSKETPTIKFTELVIKLTAQLRSLEKLGVTTSKCGALLYPIVESCIPPHRLKDWMKSSDYVEDIEKVMEFLKKEVRREIETELAQSPFATSQQTDSKKKVSSPSTDSNETKKEKNTKTPTVSSFLSGDNGSNPSCGFCEGNHNTAECRKAPSMTYTERKDKIMKAGLCLKCIRKGHVASKCKANVTCFCGGRHNMFLCNKLSDCGKSSNQTASSGESKSSTSGEPGGEVASMHYGVSSPLVPLQTLRLLAYGPTGKQREIRVALDSGSQRSYVTEELYNFLKLDSLGFETYSNELFGSVITPTQNHPIAWLMVSDLEGNEKARLKVSPRNKISSRATIPVPGRWVNEFSSRGVTFTDLKSKENEIELLIGNKSLFYALTGKKRKIPCGLGAFQTKWGWVLSGEIPLERREEAATSTNLVVTSMICNERPLSDLWELDTIGILDSTTTQTRKELEEETQKHFNSTVERLHDGRYQVHLPFISGFRELLPTNYTNAVRSLQRNTKTLVANSYLEKYNALFAQWEEDGMIEEVLEEANIEGTHYPPHRPVIKLSSSTTPIRPVFNASSREKGKLSLNETLDKGPNLLELIPVLLTRFRLNKVGVTSDIRKAFLQISVHPAHRDYLRFLWWKDETCREKKIYRHKRVVFGVTSSPYLLGATLQHHLKLASHDPIAIELANSFYVDNSVISVRSYEEAKEFKARATELLLPAKFELREWAFGPTEEESTHNVLGLNWNTKEDSFTFDLSSALQKLGETGTKRKLLSVLHSLFDPLGWLSPFILEGKKLMKDVQQLKLGWDIEFDPEVERKYKLWTNQIPSISEYHIPRYVKLDVSSSASLHVFSDASDAAYATVIFLRAVNDGRVKISLIEAKSRVSPPKKITIPRMELLGCLIAARLTSTVKATLHLPDIPVTFWTDSSTALAWITGDGPWATFVQNRVDEIRRLTSPDTWRHIPGRNNPADLPSRGCSIRKLIETGWSKGPEWLKLEENSWPTSEVIYEMEEVEKEKPKRIVSLLAPDRSAYEFPLDVLMKHSAYDKVLRISAYIIRFMKRIKQRTGIRMNDPGTPIPVPATNELIEAETWILRFVQLQRLEPNMEKVKKLKPFKDNNGLWRITSRLTHEDDDYFKRPVLLPEDDHFVKLLIRKEHLGQRHAGTQVVLANLRERYWIVNGRRSVRKVVTACVICRRYLMKRIQVPEAPLPSARTATGAPFSTTGMDMAGPLILRDGTKVWMALFTCAVYRGIHLEVVSSLSTDALLEAFRRFTSRRGRPQIVYSDNGLNFVGANRILQTIDWKKVEEYGTVNRIVWRFNPPAAAWWGGFYERMIGLVKQLIIRNLGKKSVHFNELNNLLIEIENVWNSRPLTYQSEDNRDPAPLTPNQFLRNAAMGYLPEVDVKDAEGMRKAYRKLQKLRESLRSRFRKEYLGLLLHRSNLKGIQLQVGDVVIVEQDNAKRTDWPIGVITDVIVGKGNVARTYRVKTKLGVLLRAAQRLFPLELQEPVDN